MIKYLNKQLLYFPLPRTTFKRITLTVCTHNMFISVLPCNPTFISHLYLIKPLLFPFEKHVWHSLRKTIVKFHDLSILFINQSNIVIQLRWKKEKVAQEQIISLSLSLSLSLSISLILLNMHINLLKPEITVDT